MWGSLWNFDGELKSLIYKWDSFKSRKLMCSAWHLCQMATICIYLWYSVRLKKCIFQNFWKFVLIIFKSTRVLKSWQLDYRSGYNRAFGWPPEKLACKCIWAYLRASIKWVHFLPFQSIKSSKHNSDPNYNMDRFQI